MRKGIGVYNKTLLKREYYGFEYPVLYMFIIGIITT